MDDVQLKILNDIRFYIKDDPNNSNPRVLNMKKQLDEFVQSYINMQSSKINTLDKDKDCDKNKENQVKARRFKMVVDSSTDNDSTKNFQKSQTDKSDK